MRGLVIATAVAAQLTCSAAYAADWAQKMFSVSRHDFRSVARGAKAEFEFTFKNIYLEDVRVASVRSSCGCTSVSLKNNKRSLKTYESGAIVARINSSKFLGQKSATITVTFDKPWRAEARLHVSTFIRSDFVFNPGSAQFGSVDQGAALETKVQITSPGQGALRILEVRSANPHLSAKVIERGRNWNQASYELRVRLDKDAPIGYVHDHLVLVTNDHRRSQVPLLVEGLVRATISVSPDLLFLGVLKPGQKVSKQVVVRSAKPFRIKRLEGDGDGLLFDMPAEQTAKSVHVIPVTFIAGNEPGKVTRAIRIETDLAAKVSEVLAQAVIEVAAPTQVAQVEDRPEKASGSLPAPAMVTELAGPLKPVGKPEETAVASDRHDASAVVPTHYEEPASPRTALLHPWRLQHLVDARETARKEFERTLREGIATSSTLPSERHPRGSDAGERQRDLRHEALKHRLRNEKLQRRYEELLRRNGPSPPPEERPSENDPSLARQQFSRGRF